MPSGKGSSGRSGSHSSGGGGSSFGGGSSGGHSSYRRVTYINGRRVVFTDRSERFYTLGWADTIDRILTPILFLLFMASIFIFTMYKSAQVELDVIKYDYNRYQYMINYAEDQRDNFGNDNYFVTGTITSYYLNEDAGKYYLNYTFDDQDGISVPGYTYSIYTKEEAEALFNDKEILLVVDDDPITQMTDSINYDYKDMPMEKDGEYVINKNSYQNIRKIFITAGVIAGVILISIIVVKIVGRKKVENAQDQPIMYPSCNNTNTTSQSQTYSQINSANTTQPNMNHENTYNKAHNECLDCDLNKEYYENKETILNNIRTKKKYCMYCGAETTENVEKCPNCNADLNG